MPDAGLYRVKENRYGWSVHGPGDPETIWDSKSMAELVSDDLNAAHRAALQRAQGVVEAARTLLKARQSPVSMMALTDPPFDMDERQAEERLAQALADWDKGVMNG